MILRRQWEESLGAASDPTAAVRMETNPHGIGMGKEKRALAGVAQWLEGS